MRKFWQEKERKRKLGFRERERVDFQRFVRKQLLKLKERGLSIPVVTL